MKTNETLTRHNAAWALPIVIVVLLLIFLGALFPVSEPAYADTSAKTTRLSGPSRFETGFAIADYLFRSHGAFDNMTVASGLNYPDALSGCYLAKVKDSPLLLVDKAVEDQVIQRLRMYTKPGGTVYLLGGPGSISTVFEKKVQKAGFQVVRLAQGNRYGTNLEILKEAGTKGQELLVASGENYPDSLSASAVPKPLLLVGKALTPEQRVFLKQAGITKIYILGGEGSVNKAVENELKACGVPIHRLAGANRYATSFLIARYFGKESACVTYASGQNFPDGLAGGPVAMYQDAPLLLIAPNSHVYARQYLQGGKAIQNTIIFGGIASVAPETVDLAMGRRPDGKMTLEDFMRIYPQVKNQLTEDFAHEDLTMWVADNTIYLATPNDEEIEYSEEELARIPAQIEAGLESETSTFTGFVAELEEGTGIKGIVLCLQYRNHFAGILHSVYYTAQ
ncbi:MAG: cell wall-binding repeat-containing protein [Clostridia bacterium]|nr:cell wall-binding repeat-containing protein [Clostridia bacterium]